MNLSMWRAGWSAGSFWPLGGGGVAGFTDLVASAAGFLFFFWAKAAGGAPTRAARKSARVTLPSRRTRRRLCIVTLSGGAVLHVQGGMRRTLAAITRPRVLSSFNTALYERYRIRHGISRQQRATLRPRRAGPVITVG